MILPARLLVISFLCLFIAACGTVYSGMPADQANELTVQARINYLKQHNLEIGKEIRNIPFPLRVEKVMRLDEHAVWLELNPLRYYLLTSKRNCSFAELKDPIRSVCPSVKIFELKRVFED